MKTLVVNRNIIVLIFAVILLIYGVQGISHGQLDAPTVTPGENNTSLVINFQIMLDKDVDENAYQIQLRRKTPQGGGISKCVVIQRGSSRHIAGDPGVSAWPVYEPGGVVFIFVISGGPSNHTFYIKGIFTDLEPGTTYEARYRDTNLPECVQNPPAPDPWSDIGEGTPHLVAPPRVEFVDANLARRVRSSGLFYTEEGGHIDLLKIPQASLAKLEDLDASESEIINLTGLEHATQLADLDLSENQISDISSLGQLTQLTELRLQNNQISDISSLGQLTQLTELNLEDNEITDLTPLAQLTQLSSLLLRGNPIRYPITDTSPLAQLLRENPKLDISIDIPIIITAPGGGPDLYLISDDSIQRVSLVKTNVQYIVSDFYFPRGIALDVAGGKIYWATEDRIQGANLDGANVQNVVNELYDPKYIALDVAGGKIYWATEDRIQGANLDGTNVQNILPRVTDLEEIGDIALDVTGGKMYWTDSWEDKIQRANLDRTNVQDLVTGLRAPRGIALDVAGGKIYWATEGRIQRANLDGANVQDLVTGLEYPEYIALDVASGKMYWTEKKEWEDDNDEEWYTYKIQRANLDGTNVEKVVSGLTDIEDIALSSIVRDIPDSEQTIHSDSRDAFESSILSGYTRVTLSNEYLVYGVPTKYSSDSHLGTVAYMLLAKLKGCNFATAEATRQSKVYIKTQALGEWGNFASETVCGVTSGEVPFSWDGFRITHLRFFDESSSPNIQEAIYNAATGQYELTSITYAVVSVSPASVASPAVGQQLEFSLNITGGEAVAGYQASIQFDNTTLRYVSGANGDFLPAGAFFAQPKVNGNLVQLNAASLTGESNGDGTLATLTFEVVAVKPSTLTLSDVLISSMGGETFVPQIENAQITEPTKLKGDVNGDGQVNIADLVLVASNLGKTGQNATDVNGDGQVNIADLVLVAGALGTNAAAPSLLHPDILEMLTSADVRLWHSQAQHLHLTDTTSQRGIRFLEQLLAVLIPKETSLLANYPNPFNPETWIPYQLAKPADVTLTIYAVNGQVVRQLALGHQPAGMYQNRSRAAYWDGKNELGEPVASGLYFYTFTAGDFMATRKMLIRK